MKDPNISKLFTDQVDKFELRENIIGWPAANDPLLSAVRKFYLLLPLQGVEEDWTLKAKYERRDIIKRHLEAVCVLETVNHDNINRIDSWLNARQDRPNYLTQYGRMIEGRYGKICFICGKKVEKDKTVDHVFPLAKGGRHGVENLRLAHRDCNASKNAYLIGDNISWIGESIEQEVHDWPRRTKFLVYVRDNFTCKRPNCEKGIFTGIEIDVRKIEPTGISCYDNIETICCDCSEVSKNVEEAE